MTAKPERSLVCILSGAAVGTLTAIFASSPLAGILAGVLVGTKATGPKNLRVGASNGLLMGALIGCFVILYSLICSGTWVETSMILGTLMMFIVTGGFTGSAACLLLRWLGSTPFFL